MAKGTVSHIFPASPPRSPLSVMATNDTPRTYMNMPNRRDAQSSVRAPSGTPSMIRASSFRTGVRKSRMTLSVLATRSSCSILVDLLLEVPA